MWLKYVLSAIVILVIFSVVFGLGFVFGYGLRHVQEAIRGLRQDLKDRPPAEEYDSAIVNDSPRALKLKYKARVDKGEDPIDDNESQIVSTKTPEQFRAEADTTREEKLDKWMPVVKRGK